MPEDDSFMNKNVLMLCYYFPPLTDVGCKRSVSFVSYLRQHGWHPCVVSVKNPDRAFCSIGSDAPPEGVPVSYTRSLLNLSWILGKMNGALYRLLRLANITLKRNYFHDLVCFPDLFMGWIPLTVLKSVSLVRQHDIDCIYVSSPPFSGALVGVIVKKLTGKPLVLDFRDPFAIEPSMSKAGIPAFRRRINRAIQNFLLRHADTLILNNEETRLIYHEQYPLVRDRIVVIHNGFEARNLIAEPQEKNRKFTIIYTGDFYFHSLNSTVFFEALAAMKAAGSIDNTSFQFLFYGDCLKEIARLAAEHGIEDLVSVNARIPYDQVLGEIAKSDLQLLRIVKPCLSTKLFEGIPLNIPFLATIPPGEAADIIRRYSPDSYLVEDDSPARVAEAISSAMERSQKGAVSTNNIEEFLRNFSRETLARKLMDVLENPRGLRGKP